MSMGATVEAAAFLKKGQMLHPQDYWINVNLGLSLLRLGQRDEAIRYHTAAVSLRPEAGWPRCNIANALFAQGKFDEAIARLLAATRDVLHEWTGRLRAENGDRFPEKVTAFHPAMAVHGNGTFRSFPNNEELNFLFVDLSALPARADLIKNFVYTSGTKNTVRSHTIEIFDGYMYLNGCANWSPGGVLIFSLADPLNPAFLGEYQPPGSGSERYVHDSYVRNDTIFAASIYTNGGLNIASVADKANPSHITKISYAGSGTHNVWTTTDGRYAITTDEIGSPPKTLKFWDLSSLPTPPAAPVSIFNFSPPEVEHNVFVRGKYAYVAWYTAGIVIADIHDPVNPAGAGWYDTSNDSLYPAGSYDGVWAVYPYFWSNKVTAGDMQNGLYVFSFDSLQARVPTTLIAPLHQAEFCDNTPLEFRWSRVADPLRDPHTYRLHIYGQSFDSTFATGSDTSFTLADPRILGTGAFSWHVVTLDEANQVSSQDTFAFARPAPAVAGPSGGESVKIFSQTAITWSWQCADSLEISFSTNSGLTWSPIAVVAGAPGLYTWNVPAVPTTHALIRLRDRADTLRAGTSDSTFTIFNSASISLTSPKGGELWQGGSLHQITWTSALVDSLSIEYSTDNGATWAIVVGDTSAGIGSYDWTVPGTFTSGGLIRLTDLYNNTVTDQSGTPFFVALMTMAMGEGWNLASIPVEPAYASAPVNFAFSTSPVFTYTGNYAEEESLMNGPGYWVKYASARVIPALGTLLYADTIPVVARWNMVGSISSPVAVSSITSDPGSMVLTNFFGYASDSAGYTVADSIMPGRGYWVKATVPGTLILSSSPAVSSNRIRIIPTGEVPPSPPGGGTPRTRRQRPENFVLEQNYPNPFNPATDIGYRVSEPGYVTLKIYDVLGREMATLVNEERSPGYYAARWDASGRSSGMYYARMTVTGASGKQFYQQTIKIILQK